MSRFIIISLYKPMCHSIRRSSKVTLWFQLEDMFQSIGIPQGIEVVTVQVKDTPTPQVYAVFIKGAPISGSKLSIDPIKRHASYFCKCKRSNKGTVPNN